MNEATYRDSGVDIDAGNRSVSLIRSHVRSTYRPEVLTDIGLFGGLFALGTYRQPVLVSSADGVGTKLKVAALLEKYDSIGVDLVNHCVNDIFTTGAAPLFFLDYYATGKLVPEQVEQIVKGLAAACRETGCALIGGETAEMPDLYAPGDFDLAGFIVGVAERDALLDGRQLEAGDQLVGLPSSGLHTNGFSLVRKVFGLTEGTPGERKERLADRPTELGRSLGEELLEPHRCYYGVLKDQLPHVKAMAHITGGGLLDNVPRVLPDHLAARFTKGSWPVPPIFDLIQRRGRVPVGDMYRTFNMGLGMVLVAAPAEAAAIVADVAEARVVGELAEARGERVVLVEGATGG
ncbi:MAG: phosphoribosylformylglycinamidine cyclo-ligase [Dehalococcoidales bacterium]|nr:phosphoribosylformylglycinamidine cyclo-ligase [Dehalococcoidales bacterium]